MVLKTTDVFVSSGCDLAPDYYCGRGSSNGKSGKSLAHLLLVHLNLMSQVLVLLDSSGIYS